MRRLVLLALAMGLIAAAPAHSQLPLPAELQKCDPIDPAHCLYPWPNDYFTKPDPTTDTGKRLDLKLGSMPRNALGKPIEPGPYNESDGFSPGQMIVTKVPGLDTPEAFRNTGAVPITDVARSFGSRAPVVVINARTRRRHLIWSEIDANPADPADVALLIRPAVNFSEGERYIVALRNLRDSAGAAIEAQDAFKVFRDKQPSTDPAVEERRPQMESIFGTLERAGLKRKELYLAWDFTVASERGLSERMLSIRDDAFAQLGDENLADLKVEGAAPSFSVSNVEELDDPHLARRVEGSFEVPCYLNLPGCPPGSQFLLEDGKPTRLPGNTMSANFTCNIPHSALAPGAKPARPSLYGHGLLGGADEVGAGNVKAMGNEHNMVFCATDWAGMSTFDVPNVGTILLDMGRFPTLADRVQQGMLNFLYLGRLMIHADGLASDPAFQRDGKPLIDRSRLYYDGNSQGGIIGGALTAVAPDFTRAVLGVPGMNYSTLLRRSVDFDRYATVMYTAYPDELERPLLLSMIQILWDRAEANGYAHHMTTDPLPGTPRHEVLLQVAFGDHQVANVSAEVEARTIGARVTRPALAPGRHSDVKPYYGIPTVPRFPFKGSALVVWDSGTPTPPVTNTPPREGDDPHGHPRSEASARRQKSEFLRQNGTLIDVCGRGPCFAHGYTGP